MARFKIWVLSRSADGQGKRCLSLIKSVSLELYYVLKAVGSEHDSTLIQWTIFGRFLTGLWQLTGDMC